MSRDQDNQSETVRNIGMSLILPHEDQKNRLAGICNNRTNHETKYGVVHRKHSPDGVADGGSSSGEEYHASCCCPGNGGVNTYGEEQEGESLYH